MAAKSVSVSGIDYHTLLEHPPTSNGSISPKGYVLLIHATMSNLHMWDSTVASLHGAGYSTLRIDHVGHGSTPAPQSIPSTYTIDAICSDLHQVTYARMGADAHPAAVVGTSIGGLLALRWGMQHAASGSRIVSVCGTGFSAPDFFPALWGGRYEAFARDVRDGTDELVQQTLARWFPGDAERDVRAREQELPRVRMCSLGGYRMLTTAVADFDFEKDKGSLQGERTMIVAGEKDPSSAPQVLEKVALQVPGGARFEVLRDVGHLPSVHDPEAFSKVLLDFLG